jgi:hypothetical protein
MESQAVTRYACEARHAARVAGMRTTLLVKSKHHVVHVHLHADSDNDCAAASRVGRSRQR